MQLALHAAINMPLHLDLASPHGALEIKYIHCSAKVMGMQNIQNITCMINSLKLCGSAMICESFLMILFDNPLFST